MKPSERIRELATGVGGGQGFVNSIMEYLDSLDDAICAYKQFIDGYIKGNNERIERMQEGIRADKAKISELCRENSCLQKQINILEISRICVENHLTNQGNEILKLYEQIKELQGQKIPVLKEPISNQNNAQVNLIAKIQPEFKQQPEIDLSKLEKGSWYLFEFEDGEKFIGKFSYLNKDRPFDICLEERHWDNLKSSNLIKQPLKLF